MTAPAVPSTSVGSRGWNRRATAWLARGAFAMIAVWIAAAMVTARLGWTAVNAALELPLAFVCHRMAERVISIAGTPMPLCSRCAGIWLGISVSGAIAWPALPLRVLRIVVPIALALMLVELLTQDFGVHGVYHPTRLLSGLLLGVPLGGAVGGLIDRELGGREKPRSGESPATPAR